MLCLRDAMKSLDSVILNIWTNSIIASAPKVRAATHSIQWNAVVAAFVIITIYYKTELGWYLWPCYKCCSPD